MKTTVCRTLLMLLAAGLTGGVLQAGSTPVLRVMVSIAPQAFFVERIGGNRVQVETMVQPGQSPHTYEPTPRQLAALSEADVYFRIGVAFENGFIPRLQGIVPDLPVMDTREGIVFRSMAPHSHDHEPGHSGDMKPDTHHHACCPHHGENSPDPHIWLSPALVARQAKTICDALVALDPEGKIVYEANHADFIRELNALDAELTHLFTDLPSRKFMVYHPAWGYFADAYQLVQVAVEVDGKAPPARQLARTIDLARSENIRVVFVQPQFSTKSAETIAEAIGGVVVSIDPLAKDFFANLRSVAAAIKKGIDP